jgi:hypothetical protein
LRSATSTTVVPKVVLETLFQNSILTVEPEAIRKFYGLLGSNYKVRV